MHPGTRCTWSAISRDQGTRLEGLSGSGLCLCQCEREHQLHLYKFQATARIALCTWVGRMQVRWASGPPSFQTPEPVQELGRVRSRVGGGGTWGSSEQPARLPRREELKPSLLCVSTWSRGHARAKCGRASNRKIEKEKDQAGKRTQTKESERQSGPEQHQEHTQQHEGPFPAACPAAPAPRQPPSVLLPPTYTPDEA